MESETHKHPSFGQIRFSRINGRAHFYGSELAQDHYIQMEVKASEFQRSLTDDRYYNIGQPLIKVRISSGQFAELITSLNMGGGVPCTIERLDGRKIDDLPFQESRKEFVHRKFEDRMADFTDTLAERQKRALELVSKKTLSKEDMNELKNTITSLTTEVKSNIPFLVKCFQETVDNVIHEAKTEVDNAIMHKITSVGMAELHRQNKLLSEGEE